jgi:hypothetical protein
MKKSILTVIVSGAILVAIGFTAYSYTLKANYHEDIVLKSVEQSATPAVESTSVEEVVTPEEEDTNFATVQTVPVEEVESKTSTTTELVQEFVTEDTALSPSELIIELTKVYNQAIEESNGSEVSDETKEYLQKLIQDLKKLPETVLAALIYDGELSAEIFDLADIELNPKSFLPFQNFVNSPLAEIGEQSKSSTKYTDEIGISFRTPDEDSFDTFMYSEQGQFTGVVSVSPDEDYFEYYLEEIRGVDISTFGDDISFMVTDILEPITYFFRGNTVAVNTIELSGINDHQNIAKLFFPFTSSTRVSVTLSRANNITTVGRWNFDFDGDGVTDISIGNGREFTYEEYVTIFDILESDTKISELDLATVKSYRKAMLEFIKKGEGR